MKETLSRLQEFAGRLRLQAFIALLLLSGACAGITVSVAYFDRAISSIHGSYGGRIRALNADIRDLKKKLELEQTVTRRQLDDIAGDVKALLALAASASQTAQEAATRAAQAAITAQGAAANAAKANIRVTETRK